MHPPTITRWVYIVGETP